MGEHLLFISVLIFLAFYWFEAQAAKEIALAAVKKHCVEMDVQMLDYYVAMSKIRLRRNKGGRIHIWRQFSFEFSATGAERYNGELSMLGRKVLSIQMEPYRMV